MANVVNQEDYWFLLDCDGDIVPSVSWDHEPTDQEVRDGLSGSGRRSYSPFVLRRSERVSVWEVDSSRYDDPDGGVYKIFDKSNEVIRSPVVSGKRKVILR